MTDKFTIPLSAWKLRIWFENKGDFALIRQI